MNEEIDEYDVYHQDFTTVSDWEIFIARIEEILNDWHLKKSNIVNCQYDSTTKWLKKSEEIVFNGLQFTISYHMLEPITPLNTTDETSSKSPLRKSFLDVIFDANKNFMDDIDKEPFPVSTWFGLKQYVMLFPQNPLVEESYIRIIMSSLNIAFANVDCGVPLFLKIREHWQQCYLGIFEDNELKTSFDSIHLKRTPNQCCYLNGLISLFKGKIASPVPLSLLEISAQFSYELKHFPSFAWKKTYIEDEIFIEKDGKICIELPFGEDQNPIKSVMLQCSWPRFLENTLVETATSTDFNPLMAPLWKVFVKMRDDFDCLLSDSISRLLDLFGSDQLLMDILGLSRSLGLVNPLHKITEAPITISKLVKAAIGSSSSSNASEFKGPISDDLLMSVLYYIFPDAVEEEANDYSKNMEVEPKQVGYSILYNFHYKNSYLYSP